MNEINSGLVCVCARVWKRLQDDAENYIVKQSRKLNDCVMFPEGSSWLKSIPTRHISFFYVGLITILLVYLS